MAYTTTTLLNLIKNKAFFPTGQNTFEDSDILTIASDVIENDLLPKLLQARQEFLATYDTCSITKGTGDNYYWIRIPERAVGQSIIKLTDSDENEIDVSSYWVEGSRIYIDEPDETSYRVYYYLRPGKLVATSDCSVITAIDTATGIVTCTPASDFTTSLKYDLVRSKAAFDVLSKGLTASAVGATTMTFTASDLPSELVVGDYICTADESCIPQIPVEWFGYLAALTTVQVLESLGDFEAANRAEARLKRIETNALSLISPRIQRKSKAIVRAFDDY